MKGLPKGLPYGSYTQEFREQAIRLRKMEGLKLTDAARRISLPMGTLKKQAYLP